MADGTIVNKVSIRGGFDLTGLIPGLTLLLRIFQYNLTKLVKFLIKSFKKSI